LTVSGFSFIRNGFKYDYPFREAILSVLPLCDEFVVAVGNSDDNTRDAVAQLAEADSRIRIIDTVWDDNLRTGGQVLAQQTDLALGACTGLWRFYIQGDEVLHESHYPAIRDAMRRYANDERVEGLCFGYKHFYGSYAYVGSSRKWYRREVRIVRRQPGIFSYADAQGFRVRLANGQVRKIRARLLDAEIYHYGWVRDPRAQQRKQESFNKYWHDDEWVQRNVAQADAYDYNLLEQLEPFRGTHPAVMAERLRRMDWEYRYDPRLAKTRLKDKALATVERLTGKRIGEFRNYRLLGPA
jgi:glycosyltransferase involved in cell wall biosynthesis